MQTGFIKCSMLTFLNHNGKSNVLECGIIKIRQWKKFKCHMYSHAKVDSTLSNWPDPYFVVLAIDTKNLLFAVRVPSLKTIY